MTTDIDSESGFFTTRQSKTITIIAVIVGLFISMQSCVNLPFQVQQMEKRNGAFEAEVKVTFKELREARQSDRELIITLQGQLIRTADAMSELRSELSAWRNERRATQ